MAEKYEAEVIGNAVVQGKATLEALTDNLSSSSRKRRQMSASALEYIAREKPSLMNSAIPTMVEALEQREAQTRWELLDALTWLAKSYPQECHAALESAEDALFDEDSSPVRLSALRFLCTLGAQNEAYAEEVWPLLDEAIQCYHGDYDFIDMLLGVSVYAAGALPESVKQALAQRMAFDAESGKGAIKHRAGLIIESLGV